MKPQCACIAEIDRELEPRGLTLDLKLQASLAQCQMFATPYIPTRSTRRGAKPVPVLVSYCPFCGKQYLEAARKTRGEEVA
jgi:hypothetical protein